MIAVVLLPAIVGTRRNAAQVGLRAVKVVNPDTTYVGRTGHRRWFAFHRNVCVCVLCVCVCACVNVHACMCVCVLCV